MQIYIAFIGVIEGVYGFYVTNFDSGLFMR